MCAVPLCSAAVCACVLTMCDHPLCVAACALCVVPLYAVPWSPCVHTYSMQWYGYAVCYHCVCPCVYATPLPHSVCMPPHTATPPYTTPCVHAITHRHHPTVPATLPTAHTTPYPPPLPTTHPSSLAVVMAIVTLPNGLPAIHSYPC